MRITPETLRSWASERGDADATIMRGAADVIERLQRRVELAEGELAALDRSHRDLARRLADAGRKAEPQDLGLVDRGLS